MPDGTYGVPYTAPVTGEFGSLAGYSRGISQGSLPFGPTLVSDGSPGTLITGNPEEEGSFCFTVLLTDANSDMATVVRNLSIETRALAPAEVGTAYTLALEAGGGTLPSGLGIMGSDITGNPTVVSPARHWLQVLDGDGTVVGRNFMLSPRGIQQWAAAIGDTVDNNDGLAVLVDVVGAPTGFVTLRPRDKTICLFCGSDGLESRFRG